MRKNCILVLLVCMAALFGCERKPYIRPSEILTLGEARYFINPETYVKDHQLLVFFDEDKGWRAMSTRSTVAGCDLSYQEKVLYDPCSRTYFRHNGEIVVGKAKVPLPHYRMSLREGKLLVQIGNEVPASASFYPSELKAALPKMRELNEEEGIDQGVEIPKVLHGSDTDVKGYMFIEKEYVEDY